MHPLFALDANPEPDRFWIGLAALCFLLGTGYSAWALATGRPLNHWFNVGMLAAGFACQTIFLCVRGHAIGRCPITNPFEVTTFMSWSVALTYALVGSTYRLSLLGGATAPVVAALDAWALTFPTRPLLAPQPVNPWLEAHTSFSMIACGAFALACLAGAMYLFQERQLKTRQPTGIFFRLPPMEALSVANSRLLAFGFVTLSVGLIAGFFVGQATDWRKAVWALAVWALYGAILLARSQDKVAAKWIARLSILAFSLLGCTFWGVRFIAEAQPLS